MLPKPKRKHKKRLGVDAAQRTRLLKRAGGYCECCGGKPDWRGLEIHHKESRGWVALKESMRMLIWRSCAGSVIPRIMA